MILVFKYYLEDRKRLIQDIVFVNHIYKVTNGPV